MGSAYAKGEGFGWRRILINFRTKTELYSFDIFDTLVTRKVAVPWGIFALMSENLDKSLPFDFRTNFYQIRIESEKIAREIKFNKSGTYEINFEDIYEYIKNHNNLTLEQTERLKKLEIETEAKNLIPVEANLNILKDLINKGNRVVLISDMYHSAETIKYLLSHIDSVFEPLTLYVSSEYKASKWSQKLYKKVSNIEKVKFNKWTHFGDNEFSDIKQAKKLGIKAVQTSYPKLLPYETDALTENPTNPFWQKIIGSAALCRRNKQIKHQDKYDFGASFAGPILYNYVNRVLDDTTKKGIKTLHFIARDGYIPKIIADIIIQKRNLNIKTKYIYGSRLAWRIPIENNYKMLVNALFDEHYDKLSVSFLAYRLNIDVNKLSDVLIFKDINKKFNYKDRENIKNQFLYNEEIKKLLIDHHKNNAKLLLKYFEQEIDLSEDDIAFVDVNGSGNTQDILLTHLSQLKNINIHTYYISMYKEINNNSKSKKYCYCTKTNPQYHCLELLCRTPDGQTVGYYEKNGIIFPVKEIVSSDVLLDWGFNEYLKGIIDFVQNICDTHASINDDIELVYFYYNYLTVKCYSELANIIGDIPFLTIGNESNAPKAAPKLPFWKIFFYIMSGKNPHFISEFPYITMARGNHFREKGMRFIKSFAYFDKISEWIFLNKLKQLRNKKIVLWGASIFLEKIIKSYKISYPNILGIIDKNTDKIGKKLNGYEIFSPDDIKNLKPDCVLISVKNNHQYIYPKIKEFLNNNHPEIELLPDVFL